MQASWRWVFLVNLPLSLLALVFGMRLLREVRDPAAHKSDLLGAVLLSVSVASLVAAIVEGTDWGWLSPRILGAFALAAVSGAWLVVRSFRHPNPILEPAVIRHRAVALADVSSLVFFGGFGALVLGGVLFLTGVWHESILRAGFMIAPGPLLAGLTAFPGGLLGARVGHRAVGTVGSLLFAAGGLWWITHVGVAPNWAGDYLPGSLLGGTGVGLMLPSLGGAATAPLPPQRFATGSALYAMTRQIGIALGVACLVAILGTGTAHRHRLPPRLDLHDRLRPRLGRRPAGHRYPRRGDRRRRHRAAGRELRGGRGQVGGVRHQQLVARRRGQRGRHRLPPVVEVPGPDGGGQRDVVDDPEVAQAEGVGGDDVPAQEQLTFDDPQRVARHPRLEAGAPVAALHHVGLEVLAHGLDQLRRRRPPEGGHRVALGHGFGRRLARGGAEEREEVPLALAHPPPDGRQLDRAGRRRSGGPRPAASR